MRLRYTPPAEHGHVQFTDEDMDILHEAGHDHSIAGLDRAYYLGTQIANRLHDEIEGSPEDRYFTSHALFGPLLNDSSEKLDYRRRGKLLDGFIDKTNSLAEEANAFEGAIFGGVA